MSGERIGLVFGGRTVEHRVSVASARTVGSALARAGYEVVPLGIAEDGCWLGARESAPALRGEVDALAAVGSVIARATTRGPVFMESVYPLEALTVAVAPLRAVAGAVNGGGRKAAAV